MFLLIAMVGVHFIKVPVVVLRGFSSEVLLRMGSHLGLVLYFNILVYSFGYPCVGALCFGSSFELGF